MTPHTLTKRGTKMKINNLFSLFTAVTWAFSVHAQMPQNITNVDEYFRSPSLVAGHVAMAPMRDFFDHAARLHNPALPEKKAPFYCHAMSLFIEKIYNNPHYAEHLSQDATHITELISLASRYGLGSEAVYTGLRLLHNKLKEADIMDDTAVSHLLKEMPILLEPFFKAKEPALQAGSSLQAGAKIMENMLLSEFTDHIQAPKTGLDDFFRNLAVKMANAAPKTGAPRDDQEQIKERLRNQTTTFLEQVIGKTMWYPQNFESIWDSVITMAHNIHLLGANGVLNHLDDLDSLHWSLVHRFSFFLDTYGSQLPRSFFEQIRIAIDNHQALFLEGAEVDEMITTKKDTLRAALNRAEAKAIAFSQRGIISDFMPESRYMPTASTPTIALCEQALSSDIKQDLEEINSSTMVMMA